MDDIHSGEDPARYVPHGVDPRSWIGFEQRIQERRFRALLQQIDHAIVIRDVAAARLALEEARELRPDAPDLDGLDERVALMAITPPVALSSRMEWLRSMRAVTMLAAGVALVVGIEWARPPRPLPSSRAIASNGVTALPRASSSAASPQDAATAGVPPAATVVASTEPDVAIPDAVATSGIEPAINLARPAVGGPAAASFRPQALVDGGVQESAREVHDVDAATDARSEREANADTTDNTPVRRAAADPSAAQPSRIDDAPNAPPERVAAPPALVASVAPVPTSIGLIAPTASNAAFVEARTRITEEGRVAQVLDQYARAYGQLDVRAARKVWPTVDERALARAFASLQSQDVSFENCNVSVSGATATASCRGRATYVGKVGNRDKRTEARQWTFELRRDVNDDWQIERAQAQRMTN
jgi:hypothetical protein